ncbi:MAG: choice-of-anchor J domain-containing protein, partial [Bacteroidales bacterium]|nr:choice-of-anchor J domain-containing protein [Bacteroidales bacterium]
MRKLLSLWALLALLLPLATQAQQTLTVADGTVTNTNIPLSFGLNGWQTEVVYPASMLSDMVGASITGVTFYTSDTSNVTFTGTTTVRVGEVASHTPYTSRGDMHLSSADAVSFAGTVTITAGQAAIVFDEPYTYGGDDLVINIFNPASTTGSSFVGITHTANNSGYDWSITSPSWETYTASTFLPKATFAYLTSGADICYRPKDFAVSGIISTEITLSWIDTSNTSASYNLQIINGTDTVTVPAVSSPYTASGLTPNTPYTFRLQSDCGSGQSGWVTIAARTPCAAQSIPDTIDFEDATPDAAPSCWTPLGGDVFVRNSTTNAHGGSMYLDFRGTLRNMIALPSYEDDLSGLQIRFWTRPENFTNNNCGTFEVGYITNLTDTSTFSPIVSYTYSDFTAYEEKEVSFASAPAGAYIAFLHKAHSTSWYWYVDDIIVEPISSCPRPASVAASAIGSDEATITVNDPTDHGSYQYTLYVNDTTQVTSDVFSGTTTTIYSLSPNTVYRVDVAASCGSEVSNPVSTTFRTQCVALTSTDLPYEMDFNEAATNAMPDCWTKLNLGGTSNQNYPFVTTTTNPDGTSGRALYFYAYATTQREYAIMPTVDDLSGLMVSFFAKGSTEQSITVGIMEDPTDTTTFTALQTIPMTSSSNWTNHEVSFDSYTGSGLNVAFRVSGTGANNSLYIDDVALLAAPACERPQGVSVRAITTNSATLHIDDTNLVGNYNILLISGSDTTTLSSIDTVYYLTGLNHSSGYKVIVNAVCSDASVTTSVSTNFFTECELISTFPYTENFDSWATGATGVPNCWNRYYYNGYSGSTTSHPYASSDESHSASNALRMYSSYYFDDYDYYDYYEYSASFMPEFSVPLNSLTMSFWYKAKPYYASNVSNISLAVGVSQTTGDTSTFTRLLTILPTDTAWHEYDLDLSSYTGTGTRITFIQFSDDGYGYSDYGYIDDILVDQLGDCARPATVTVSNIDTTSALISWTDINETGSYSVRWTDSDSITVTNDLSYTLTGLTPATVYTVTVRRICDDASLTGAREVTFQTALVPIASLPYSTGFEASDDTDWQFITGNANPWTIGSATANGGTQSLYISNDGGTSNAYTVSTATINFAARNFDLAEGEYALSFDWKAAGESNYDFIRVFVCHDSVTPDASLIPSSSIATATPAGWQDVVGGKLNLQGTNWQNANGTFNIAEAGLYKVVFMWRNDASGGTQPPAAIDNVTLAALACPAPVNLVVDSLSSTSATLRWSATGEETAWIVSINGEAWQQVSDTTLALSGLTPSSAYSVVVRALCSATDTSFALSGNFTTACGAITALPWSEDFDALTDINQLQCWDRYTGLYTGATTTLTSASSGWIFSTANVLGGTNHLRVNVYGTTCNRWIVTPEFALTSPAKLTFNYALTAYNSTNPISTSNSVADDRFLVLVTTDGGSSWTPIATWDSTGAAFANIPNTGDSASLSLSAYTGQNIRIAFYTESILTGGDNDLHIDNIAITIDTTAPAPTTYTVTLATANATMGSVSPAGNTTVVENGSFTATATANAGYRFVAWTDATGATVSTANPYTFTVTANTALTATFEAESVEPTMYTITVNYDATRGTVTGAGTYLAGTSVTLVATSNPGYRFAGWS